MNKYIQKASEYLGIQNASVQTTDFAWIVIKGNQYALKEKTIEEFSLDLEGLVLHERVAIIRKNLPIRSHEEETQEIVTNIGDSPIWNSTPYGEFVLNPGQTMYSYNGEKGFMHGWTVERISMLYVAKALKPEFVEGNSFRMPENTYHN